MEAPPRPDPSRGVFETMLVVGGEPVALEAHLARLESSLAELYDGALPVQARRLVAERAAGLALGRLRLTVAPGKGADNGSAAALRCEAEAGQIDRPLHFPLRPLSLRPHSIAGGLGCHKWVDRTTIPRLPPDQAPLLVDRGEVLEAGWANIFAVRGGTLFTPPLDGRVLPGVTRATVIELARARGVEVVERGFSLRELREAEEAFLTNSIRGIESVGTVGEEPLAGPPRIASVATVDLRARWGLDPIPTYFG